MCRLSNTGASVAEINLWIKEEAPVEIKITRKLLDDYRRLKREIPLLELELVEML